MAKTYEALLKSEGSSHEEILSAHSISRWQCPDLTDTKEIGNLWNNIDMARRTNAFKKINFVGSRSGEGTSTIVFNLARFIMANNPGKDVLVIDANLERPVIHLAFGLPRAPGLVDVLRRKVEYSEAIHRVSSSDLYAMPAGGSSSDTSLRVEQEDFSALISAIQDRYQYILIDSSRLLTSSDSIATAISTDMTFLIVRAGSTQWEIAETAKNYLLEFNCNIGGVILNRVLQPTPRWIYDRL